MLSPTAQPIAAAVLRVKDGLLAAVPSIVGRWATISKERLEIVKVLSEKLVLMQLTSCDKFGLNVAATAVAFGSVDCVSFLLMDRSLPHNQPVRLLMRNVDAYVCHDSNEPPQYSTVSLSLCYILPPCEVMPPSYGSCAASALCPSMTFQVMV